MPHEIVATFPADFLVYPYKHILHSIFKCLSNEAVAQDHHSIIPKKRRTYLRRCVRHWHRQGQKPIILKRFESWQHILKGTNCFLTTSCLSISSRCVWHVFLVYMFLCLLAWFRCVFFQALGIPLTQLVVTVTPTTATSSRRLSTLWEVTYQAPWQSTPWPTGGGRQLNDFWECSPY